jgi:hypothetical protein
VTRGRARRAVFAAYALALFTATHWPRLALPMEGRPDLWIHCGIFAAWTGLLIACGFFGRPLSGRNIALCVLAGVLYAAVDELLQAIPALHRTAAWDDWGLDVLGVCIAAALAALLSRRSRATPP